MPIRPSAALLLLAAGCASTVSKTEIDQKLRQGDFRGAVEGAAARVEANPGDAEAVEAHRQATVMLLLDEGRQLTFQDRDEDALDRFYGARELDPGSKLVSDWIAKTREKLAVRWLDVAYELLASDELGAADEAFQAVLYYRPGDESATAGLERVQIKAEYRRGMGEQYYKDGVNELRDHALNPARGKFEYVWRKYLPEDPRAGRRLSETERAIAEEKIFLAGRFEQMGMYRAARNEFRIALTFDEESTEALEGFERLEREVEARTVLEQADMLVRRGRIDEAEESLRAAIDLSERQRPDFDAALQDLERQRYGAMYDEARTYERDFRFDLAVEAYTRLIEIAGFYDDALTRRDTLEGFIEQAAELYEAAMATEDEEERRSLLMQIEIFWPEYRDVEELLYSDD